MVSFSYGGKTGQRYSFSVSEDRIAVRTKSRARVLEDAPYSGVPLSLEARGLLAEFEPELRFSEAGVQVLRIRGARKRIELRDRARAVLNKEPEVRFAGRVLCEAKSKAPVLYTENLFLKLDDDSKPPEHRKLFKRFGLTIKRALDYARNAYFVGAAEGSGIKVFAIAEELLAVPIVELCHPELIRGLRRRTAFDPQWHLKKTVIGGQPIEAHAHVEAAWALSEGAGTIIAVIDDGVDLDHEEFRSSGKIVAPRDVTRRSSDPRPADRNNHGTACAGVACADGRFGASGVAPRARLLPIRLNSGLGSQAEADAFIWAMQNGADVISCSWGPADGDFTDPNDPLHRQRVPLPDSTRLAIDQAVRNGRNGKGCVIVFAAGNGNESVDNDGYASYEKVIAVAACNDVGRKASYSDFGQAVWCAFPSGNGLPSKTPGIWTTDRSGPVGYNPGSTARGDAAGNYTNSFGGTSSAAPGLAGVCALILAHNPALRWDEVKDILKRSCDRIDPAGGAYDVGGHSDVYGYGRVHAKRAVELAKPAQAVPIAIRAAVQDVPIGDRKTARLAVAVADTTPLRSLEIGVDIEHTYIGDLVVTLESPPAIGIGPVVLHNREGRGTDNIKKTYDAVSTPALAAFSGKSPAGQWSLVVKDRARLDTGRIRSVTLALHF